MAGSRSPRSWALALVFLSLAGTPSLAGQVITEFPVFHVAGAAPWKIVAGPDGNMWFSYSLGTSLGRITPSGQAEYVTDANRPLEVLGLTNGQDGAVWFTDWDVRELVYKIGRVTSDGEFTYFNVPDKPPKESIWGITAGPDGALWYVTLGNDADVRDSIGRMTTDGNVTKFPVPEHAAGPHFTAEIAAGSDGALWFAVAYNIGRITTDGSITLFPLPEPAPTGITEGPDGNIWFTEFYSGKVARIAPDGTIDDFGLSPGTYPNSITAASDGALWCTEYHGPGIARITTDGQVTEFRVPTPSALLEGIAAGPGGTVWFVEQDVSKIGRIEIPVARDLTLPPRRPRVAAVVPARDPRP